MHNLKIFYIFIKDLIKSRSLIWQLTKRDFKANYLGSYFGLLWAFIQPLVTILVLWFVFTVGFKTGPTTTGCPFILWFIAGIIPWFFVSDALANGTSSIVAYSYLVKKVLFRVSTLPIVKMFSSLIVHVVLIIFMMIVFFIYGYYPTMYWFQIPYFILATFFLVLGLSWLTASLNVFTKDIGQIVGVILQIGFWGTPIFWSFSRVENHKIIAFIMKLNPFFYIIQGYRDSLIYNISFWEGHWQWTIYFWCVTLFILVLGGVVFRKLRPHFADVL